MIAAIGASLIYSDHGREIFACRELDVDIRSGEFVGILGPSGSGKSSLLYLLSGLKQPSDGQIKVDGTNIALLDDAARSRMRLKKFGFVFQQPYLLGYLTALENILVSQRGVNFGDQAWELMESLGIAEKAHRLPHELSGGERQRVCVARALLGNPQAIFADEPTASLDHANGLQVVELLNRHRGNGALVMVTHDPSMLDAADRVFHIDDGRLTT